MGVLEEYAFQLCGTVRIVPAELQRHRESGLCGSSKKRTIRTARFISVCDCERDFVVCTQPSQCSRVAVANKERDPFGMLLRVRTVPCSVFFDPVS